MISSHDAAYAERLRNIEEMRQKIPGQVHVSSCPGILSQWGKIPALIAASPVPKSAIAFRGTESVPDQVVLNARDCIGAVSAGCDDLAQLFLSQVTGDEYARNRRCAGLIGNDVTALIKIQLA